MSFSIFGIKQELGHFGTRKLVAGSKFSWNWCLSPIFSRLSHNPSTENALRIALFSSLLFGSP